ncbi:MAG: hypothetical protein FDZ70_02655 [Actinobacteria bacterium]|nr:MAG: hypothetical protein FDZ70_02655 [Actinomycetota bacterium]
MTGGTAALLGRTGFAYLYGLRSYAAAMLWSTIDPVYHEYYADQPLTEQVQLIPTVRIVQLLDPQFEQSYYIAAWMIARRGDVAQGLEVSRTGVENNPASGLLRASYAQMLLTLGHQPKAALAQADAALSSPDTVWYTDEDRCEGIAIFAAVYDLNGDSARADELRALSEALRDVDPVQQIGGSHDHDGDGVPDH